MHVTGTVGEDSWGIITSILSDTAPQRDGLFALQNGRPVPPFFLMTTDRITGDRGFLPASPASA